MFADLLRSTGLKRSQLYARLKRAREDQPIWDENALESNDIDDRPLVPIVYGPSKGVHYNYRDDEDSVLPSGLFRIGIKPGLTRIVHASDGPHIKTQEPSKHKHKPRSRVRQPKKLTPEEVEAIKAKSARKKKRVG